MARDIDLLTVEEVIAFVPNDRQISLKMLLHERMNPQVIGKLTLSTLESIEPYISPYSLSEVFGWVERYPGFYEWLFTPESFTVTLQKSKEKAAQTMIEMLDIDNYDDSINPKVLQLKLKAAELLLKSGMKREQRITNTVKLSGQLPKHLASKSVEALEAEVKKLKE
jgi:hypothetical protein